MKRQRHRHQAANHVTLAARRRSLKRKRGPNLSAVASLGQVCRHGGAPASEAKHTWRARGILAGRRELAEIAQSAPAR